MKDGLILLFHLLAVIARLLRPGGERTLVAENLLLKQQLLLHSRSRSRAPNLSTLDRVLLGYWTLFLNPKRITRVGIIVQAGTLLKFHDSLKKRKYRLLHSSGKKGKPGPKGPYREVIDAEAYAGSSWIKLSFGRPQIWSGSFSGINSVLTITARIVGWMAAFQCALRRWPSI